VCAFESHPGHRPRCPGCGGEVVAEMKSIDDRDLKTDQLTQFNVLDPSPTWRVYLVSD